jgi:hypothetical protein
MWDFDDSSTIEIDRIVIEMRFITPSRLTDSYFRNDKFNNASKHSNERYIADCET